MSQLSDRDIEYALLSRDIIIEPLDVELIQPASIDVRLGDEFIREDGESFCLGSGTEAFFTYKMEPGEFLLGHTLETITLPPHYAARIEGKSTLGRKGLGVHVTAGFIDPGFFGQLTLEMKNMNQKTSIELYPDMLIAQISFHKLSTSCVMPYGHPARNSHYQGQIGAHRAYDE